jgi:hypothetical protein
MVEWGENRERERERERERRNKKPACSKYLSLSSTAFASFKDNLFISNTLITHSNFYFIFPNAAQQEAEKAKYVVLGAQQEKKTIITRARGEAESAELIGLAVKKNPGFMKLRRIDAARDIADIVAKSGNKVYLNADSLLLNLLGDGDEKLFEKSVKKRGWFW